MKEFPPKYEIIMTKFKKIIIMLYENIMKLLFHKIAFIYVYIYIYISIISKIKIYLKVFWRK